MEHQLKEIERCTVCLQPTTVEYKFVLSYLENGTKVKKPFCGASCLTSWIEKELDKTHLDTLDSIE